MTERNVLDFSVKLKVQDDEDEFPLFRNLIAARIANATGPIFTTNRTKPSINLYDKFLSQIPKGSRGHYQCRCCRDFVNDFGGLVVLDNDFNLIPLIWTTSSPKFFTKAVNWLAREVADSTISGVFLSSLETFGTPVTGNWTHLYANNQNVFKETTLTAGQKMAEKKEDYRILRENVANYSKFTVEQAIKVMTSGKLWHVEKTMGNAEWLRDVIDTASPYLGRHRDNVFWKAVATAPAGFCHFGSSMLGTLLKDIVAKTPFDVMVAKWNEKADPLKYQRPTAVAQGTINRAESIFAKLGLESSMARRYARFDEVSKFWTPRRFDPVRTTREGFFSTITPTKAKGRAVVQTKNPAPISMSAGNITWKKFERDVLPDAAEIEYFTTSAATSFFGMTTAVNPLAEPLLAWDNKEKRNPVGWYVIHGGSYAEQWGLPRNSYVKVTGICNPPCQWNGEYHSFNGMVLFILQRCRPIIRSSCAAIFPETLRNDLHEIRSVIEAKSHQGTIVEREKGDANGVIIGRNGEHKFRVTDRHGNQTEYIIDRFE